MAERKRANDLDGKQWLRNSISIWSDVHKTSEERALKYPALFPIELAKYLIETFTRSDQKTILDPFAGSGSTVLAAELLGRDGIGIELSGEYVELAQQRDLSSYVDENTVLGSRTFYNTDARNLLTTGIELESVDFVLTSPPYWDILLQRRTADYKEVRHYGQEVDDLGKISDYAGFMTQLSHIFNLVYDVMKPGAYCCVVVMDIRKKNRFYPFHSDLADEMQDLGFIYDDLIIWDRRHEYNNMRPLGYPSVFRVNKAHEFILIFQRPKVD